MFVNCYCMTDCCICEDFLQVGKRHCVNSIYSSWTCSLPLRWVFGSHPIATTGSASTIWWFVVHEWQSSWSSLYLTKRPSDVYFRIVGRNHHFEYAKVPAATWKSSIVASLGYLHSRFFSEAAACQCKNTGETNIILLVGGFNPSEKY